MNDGGSGPSWHRRVPHEGRADRDTRWRLQRNFWSRWQLAPHLRGVYQRPVTGHDCARLLAIAYTVCLAGVSWLDCCNSSARKIFTPPRIRWRLRQKELHEHTMFVVRAKGSLTFNGHLKAEEFPCKYPCIRANTQYTFCMRVTKRLQVKN